MNDTTTVHIVYDLKELKDNVGQYPLSHAHSVYLVVQFTAIDLLHDDEHLIFVFEHLSHLNNPRMPNHFDDLYFLAQKFQFLLLYFLLVNYFHCE